VPEEDLRQAPESVGAEADREDDHAQLAEWMVGDRLQGPFAVGRLAALPQRHDR